MVGRLQTGEKVKISPSPSRGLLAKNRQTSFMIALSRTEKARAARRPYWKQHRDQYGKPCLTRVLILYKLADSFLTFSNKSL